MKKTVLLLSMMLAGAFFMQQATHALSLKIAPLEYRTTLKNGEKQKGFIDVSNPTDQAVRVKTSPQAFRQIDNDGTLQFHDDEQVRAGVKLDLDEFEIGPREAVRMYFQLDGSKLPSGDVYAAIFFATDLAKGTAGVGQSVRLGTLLSIVNGTPGPRHAEITALNIPWLQFDDTITGSYAIKNTADPTVATGFYPDVTQAATPFGQTKQERGKLVFAGITRDNKLSLKASPLGISHVTVRYGDSVQSRWVIAVTPAVLVIVLISLVVFGLVVRVVLRHRARRRRGFAIEK